MNGRINFEGGTPFFLQDKIVKDSRTTYDNLKYSQQNTVVSNLFFSAKNAEILQNGIRAGVYKMSDEKYIIDNQNTDALNVIMRAIYLQNSLNTPDNVTKQIEDLKIKLFPFNGLQERTESFFSLCIDGDVASKIELIYENLDPLEKDLIMLFL